MKKIILPVLLLFLVACAKMVQPSGGPLDTMPPQLDTAMSSPLIQTNFQGDKLEFTFDEFIVVQNALKEVIISPPLNHPPELIAKRRTAVLTFNDKDTLRENTTYTIQFNDAIGDYTEGNKVKNLLAVFSTGEVIDSNELQVLVRDNATGGAAEGIHVMLYKNHADSVVHTEKPYYATVSSSSGQATFRFIQDGTYKIFALKDENVNLLYDLPSEKIGFLDTLIDIPHSGQALEIAVFEAEQALQIKDYDCTPYGKCRFIFNKPLDKVQFSLSENDAILHSYPVNDTLILWHDPDFAGNQEFYVELEDGQTDTTRMKLKAFDSTRYSKRNYFPTKGKHLNLNPIRGADISTLKPIRTLNPDSISLKDTSGVNLSFDVNLDSINSTILHIYADEPGEHKLQFLPGALEDYYGEVLKDTVEFTVKIEKVDDLSNLFIVVEDLDTSKQYIFRILKKDLILDEQIIYQTDSIQLEYPAMAATDYNIMLITDRNGNGKYDKGSYEFKQQPESFVIKEIQGMRPGWDLQEKISPFKEDE